MPAIVTKTDITRNPDAIDNALKNNKYVITTKGGKGKHITFQYIEGIDDVIDRFAEDMEMHANKEHLQEKLQASAASGPSDLVI